MAPSSSCSISTLSDSAKHSSVSSTPTTTTTTLHQHMIFDETKADQEPAIKKRKRTAVRPRSSPPPPPTIDLDLNIGSGNWQQPAADDEDQWKIKKVLKKSDVDGSSRLLLGKLLVQEHILLHLVMGEAGVEVKVWDVDTGTEHMLLLKKWKSNSFVFVKNWMSVFVTRRDLEEKDEIGLRWNHANSRLDFTLLRKGN
ncbi:UNVERIFIED_CONTAM: hypothetical protein Slati_0710500 [Sesamum latifolium]|uniref:B3 domain-containing protein n=1 Tax=Sesamum latifolium TaxID=2727402 RepID=A0AAW2Y500_9LAMI